MKAESLINLRAELIDSRSPGIWQITRALNFDRTEFGIKDLILNINYIIRL